VKQNLTLQQNHTLQTSAFFAPLRTLRETNPHPYNKTKPNNPLRSLHPCELCVYKTSPYNKTAPLQTSAFSAPLRTLRVQNLTLQQNHTLQTSAFSAPLRTLRETKPHPTTKSHPYKPLRSLHLCELCVYKTSPYNKTAPLQTSAFSAPLRTLRVQNLTLPQNHTLQTSAFSAPLRTLRETNLHPYNKTTLYKPLRSLHLCELCVKQNLTKKQNKTKQIPSRNRTT